MSAKIDVVATMTLKEHQKKLKTLAREWLLSDKTQRDAMEKSRMDEANQKKMEDEKYKMELEKQKAEEAKRKSEVAEALLKDKLQLNILDAGQWVAVDKPNSVESSIANSSSCLGNPLNNSSDSNSNNNTNTMLLVWDQFQLAASSASATASHIVSSAASSVSSVVSTGVSLTANLMSSIRD